VITPRFMLSIVSGLLCCDLTLAASSESVVMPPFAIKVSLSSAARRELSRRHETVMVEAHFSGEPKPESTFRRSDVGLDLGYASRELTSEGVAEFKNVTLPRKKIEALVDRDYRVTVNVFSGRRSGPNNLLSCNVVDGKISHLKGKTHLVTCPLIAETPAFPR
jgi:hypothetical protein